MPLFDDTYAVDPEEVNFVNSEAAKKLAAEFNIPLYVSTFPGCCSGLVLQGFYGEVRRLTKERIVEFLTALDRESKSHAFIVASCLDPQGGQWPEAFREAGWGEPNPPTKSNSYNGGVPLRVFVKVFRPMTEEEVKASIEAQTKRMQQMQKGGYA